MRLAVGDLGEDKGDEGAEVVEDAGGLAEGLEDGLLAAEGEVGEAGGVGAYLNRDESSNNG